MKTKRNIIIAALFITLLAFLGCRKCADCTTTTTTTINGVEQPKLTVTTRFTACGRELREADGSKVVMTAIVNNNQEQVTTAKTKCK
jgi:ABC-type Zn uptake system ZnuABC Zn-binding protein ZnuA